MPHQADPARVREPATPEATRTFAIVEDYHCDLVSGGYDTLYEAVHAIERLAALPWGSSRTGRPAAARTAEWSTKSLNTSAPVSARAKRAA